MNRRLKKLEKYIPPRCVYVIFDLAGHVLALPGGYMTAAEFESRKPPGAKVTGKTVGVDLSKI